MSFLLHNMASFSIIHDLFPASACYVVTWIIDCFDDCKILLSVYPF